MEIGSSSGNITCLGMPSNRGPRPRPPLPPIRYNTPSSPHPAEGRGSHEVFLMSDRRFPDVPGGYPFPRLEAEVLEQWRSQGIFEKSLEKHVFPRYRTMRGYHVARKAGWDTHGLPVEIEVEKRLGFSGKQQIEAYGIEKFNQACLESVHTYEKQWRAMTERIGYWLDLDNAYYTYTNEYIESVWWALSELAK